MATALSYVKDGLESHLYDRGIGSLTFAAKDVGLKLHSHLDKDHVDSWLCMCRITSVLHTQLDRFSATLTSRTGRY